MKPVLGTESTYAITREGKTQAQFEAEIADLAKALGTEDAHNLQLEYCYKAVVSACTFGGCETYMILKQNIVFGGDLDHATPQASGSLNAYIVTPNGSYHAHGLNLENFNAEPIAMRSYSAMFHQTQGVVAATAWVQDRANKIFGQWWRGKIETIKK